MWDWWSQRAQWLVRSHDREVYTEGRFSAAHLELRRAVELDVYGVWGLGLIHSDRVVCQMQFSAKYTDWSLLRQILWQSFSRGRNKLKRCVTEPAEPTKSPVCARWQLNPEKWNFQLQNLKSKLLFSLFEMPSLCDVAFSVWEASKVNKNRVLWLIFQFTQ